MSACCELERPRDKDALACPTGARHRPRGGGRVPAGAGARRLLEHMHQRLQPRPAPSVSVTVPETGPPQSDEELSSQLGMRWRVSHEKCKLNFPPSALLCGGERPMND